MIVALLALPATAHAQQDAGLAQELTNPIADLVTVPIQMTFDQKIGPANDGARLTTNVQPVVPFHLNQDWNLITRTIVPIVWQQDIFPGAGGQYGLGDINATLFLSPSKATADGVIWGAGGVFLLPTGSDDLLSAKKWGAGPAGVVVAMRGPWTMGMLVNHIWSYAGADSRPSISNTFLQPFAAYTWPGGWTASAQAESTYNWQTEHWSVPITFAIAKLVRLGALPVSLQAGVGYWAESVPDGAQGMRFRLQANFVLPR